MAETHYEKLEGLESLRAEVSFNTKTPELQGTADAFKGNVLRILNLGRLPAQIYSRGLEFHDAIRNLATNFDLRVAKEPDEAKRSENMLKLIDDLKAELEQNVYAPLPGKPLIRGIAEMLLNMLFSTECAALMASQIIGTWTTFETLAGDLWETAINVHPSGLADLKGSPDGNKHAASAKADVLTQAQGKRTAKVDVSLAALKKMGYDTRGRMGSLLRSSRRFSTLDGIVEAYRSAFWQDDQAIERAITSRALRKLSVARNVLVHRNGEIDGEFLERSRSIPDFQRYKEGDTFVVDGATVADLVKPAVEASKALILAVDDWIAGHPQDAS